MSGISNGSEQRQFGRRQTFLHGWVKVPGRPLAACVIRNMSATGALLEFDRVERLPYSFILKIEGTDQTYGCEVRHAYDKRVGVGFVDVAAVQANIRASYGGEVGAWVKPGSLLSRK